MKTNLLHAGFWAVLFLPTFAPTANCQNVPVAADGPSRAQSAPTDSTDPLASAKIALDKAVGLMRGATANNKGGYVERSRNDLDQATAILNEWLADRQDHPEANSLPPSPSDPIDVLSARIADVKSAASSRFPNLQSTLKSLHAALEDLQRVPGGDIGGFRSRLVVSLDLAATDVIAGINFAVGNAGPGAAHTITPLGPPANATAFYSGTMNATKRLELARYAVEQTETALREPPTRDLDELAVAPIGRDQALASCSMALADVAAALAYIQTYPANNDLSGAAMSPEDPPVRLSALPPALDRNPAGRFTNPPLVAALDALNEALNALTNARPDSGEGTRHPVISDLGGYRLKLMRDLSQVQADINAGLNETYDTYVAAHTTPKRPGTAPGLGT